MSATRAVLQTPPNYAVISGATNGNNTLVAAITSRRIRVLSLFLMSAGTVTLTFQSAAAGTALSGAIALTAQSGFTLPYNPVGWFQTVAGELLNMALGAGVQVSGVLVYQIIDPTVEF